MARTMVTDSIFKERVFNLVGNEYTFLERYKKAKTKIKVVHNKCGYEYKVTPDNFFSGRRCPKCFGGIKRTNSEFVSEVRKLVGNDYTFLEGYKGNHTPLKIIHNECGNEYKVSPSAFINSGQRCPECAIERRRFIMSEVEFLEGIYDLVGDEYTFSERYKGSREKIKVRHNVCGSVYRVSPQRFRSGSRCKKCSDDEQRKSNVAFTKEVFEKVGDEYVFLEEYINARTNIKVRHGKCGRIYLTTPNNFLRGNRCPNCFASKGEEKIEKYLREIGIVFEREITFPDLKIEGFLRYDFGIYGEEGEIKLLIEYDGRQHFEPIDIWGGDEGFEKVLKSDGMKNSYAIENGIPLKRIPYWEYDNISEILDSILS